MKTYGFSARIRFVSGTIIELRNLTEIHYNYENPVRELMGEQVAFESSIYSTGSTYRRSDIAEFEVFPETRKESHHYRVIRNNSSYTRQTTPSKSNK
jgi:hypothetical protein